MSSSSSPVIPKEKLTAYQRWELHSFDQPSRAAPAAAPAAPAEDEAAKVRHLNAQAFEAGRAEGRREGAAQAAAEAQRFAQLMESVGRQAAGIDRALADDLVALALGVARQLVGRQLAAQPESVLGVVQEAIDRVLQPATQASLTLHPADAALVQSHLAETLAAGGWRIIEDPQMERGGCRLHTAACELDATLDTRWRRIAGALGQELPWQA